MKKYSIFIQFLIINIMAQAGIIAGINLQPNHVQKYHIIGGGPAGLAAGT